MNSKCQRMVRSHSGAQSCRDLRQTVQHEAQSGYPCRRGLLAPSQSLEPAPALMAAFLHVRGSYKGELGYNTEHLVRGG